MTIIDQQLVFNSNHADRGGAPTGIVLHHAAANGSVESVHDYHKNQNGWAGIGYHFYVRKDGAVYRGRPEEWLGAHTVGHNDKLGVCAEGNFDTEQMSAAQQAAITELVQYLFDKYGKLSVYAHRELDATACPGERYPFEAIKDGSPARQDNKVLRFQQAAIADGVALPRYGADGIWGNETAAAASRLVRYGDTGERVRLVQALLGERGYDLGAAGIDGIFGVKTQEVVKAFQATAAIGVDGIVGINTWQKLLGVAA